MSTCAPQQWGEHLLRVLGPCPVLSPLFSEQGEKASMSPCPKVAKPVKKPLFLIPGVRSSAVDLEDGGDGLGVPWPPPSQHGASAYRGSSNTGVTRGCDFISHIKSLLCCLEKHYCYVLISDERTHAWVGISPSTRKALKTRWLPCLFNVYNLALATTVGNPGFF